MKLPTEIKAIIQDMVWGAHHFDKYRSAIEQLSLIRRSHRTGRPGDNLDWVIIYAWDLRLSQYFLKLNGDRYWRFEYIYFNGKRIPRNI